MPIRIEVSYQNQQKSSYAAEHFIEMHLDAGATVVVMGNTAALNEAIAAGVKDAAEAFRARQQSEGEGVPV